MEENKKLIVVPWDFTPVAEHALAHAVKISRMVGNDICLLHIVDTAIKAAEEADKKKSFRKSLKKTAQSIIPSSPGIFQKEASSQQ